MRSKPPTPTNPLDAVKQAITSKVRSKIEEKFGGPGRTLHNLQTLGGYFNNGWEVVTALLADDEGKPPSNKFGSVHSGKDTLTNVDLKPEKSTVDDDSKRIFYKAKRFQLPKFSDLFKEERPLYGEVQTLPDGQFKIPCQALKQSGNHCSRSVVVAHDPRTHGWSTIGNELCCWQHQDALAATHAQATSISQGPYQGVIDPRLSKPIKDSLYAELQKPISPADRPGFIYVYQLVSQSRPRGWQLGLSGDQDVTVRLKIGRSVDVDRRMKQWQGQCGYELYLLEFFPAPVDPTPSSKLTSTLESKLLSLPDTNFSLSTPFLESLPANLKRYLVGNLLRENPRAARLIEEAADRAAGDDDHYNERGANGSQSRTVGHHQDSAAATALRRVTHQAASKPGAMTPPDLPRCAHANKAERLIHLTLAPHRVHQEACSACGSIHKEWFETKVPRSAFVSMKDDAGQVGTGWHLDPKAWYGMEFREVIIHWLRYLQDQYGLA
ncbi:hypothetical protein IWQ60_005523 [Tieghemiomyces parasiticus]|uniref:Bacteriophage T5 Orf172 DNA-binding domain-containing protein n=1 Tax=Tieghemiomyces parasiticus TaxID=78921 RepID=A0A9W8AEH0_9FUNG|nr:hypothetical protein IWQ60_005523 [Tieghemiomyces parasiticus]